MASPSINIMAEHPGPLTLSGDEVEIRLGMYEENRPHFNHKSLLTSRVFLNFHRIFGEPGSPNYDVFLVAHTQGGALHYIGSLSFFSVRPKNPDNNEGMNLKIKIESPIKELLGQEASKRDNLTLQIKPQDQTNEPIPIEVEFIFLCCMPHE
ncbi:hypothetical protein ONV78_30470 [Hahella sp. CR1]|uniref:DUF7868 domain-containing protein n=1 Tax=Hahella sp. CR1 TaxID=2992807 RepID=UPI002441A0ED|nr:hypothetical protein [Hahella sp. CR1]MDG9672097.1 hypothetical protein [Hahella sp. CR1]